MAVPTLTSISPESGPTAGASLVDLVGTGLDTVTAVTFGSDPAADFAILSATRIAAVTPAGSGTTSVTVTNPDGTSNAVSFVFSDGLFTLAEARAFDKAQLADAVDFPADTITAKEAEIREWLERVCGVNFVPTTHTDEYHDGSGSQYLTLDWPRIVSVTAASTRSDATWTALTADELAKVQLVRDAVVDRVYREGSSWPRGVANLKVTYVAGYSAVPALVKRAALVLAVNELPGQNTPWQADGFEAGGTTFSWTRGDGYNGAWSPFPDVMRAIRLYSHRPPAVA